MFVGCERNVFQSTRTALTRRPVQRRPRRAAGRDAVDRFLPARPMTSNSNAADRSVERQATASASAACTAPSSPVPCCAMSNWRSCVGGRLLRRLVRHLHSEPADQHERGHSRPTSPGCDPVHSAARSLRTLPGSAPSSPPAKGARATGVERGGGRARATPSPPQRARPRRQRPRPHARPEEHGHELARTLRVVGTSHANGRRRVTGVDRMRCRICVDRSGWTSCRCSITRRRRVTPRSPRPPRQRRRTGPR